jgi:short-subunit dehydrogenase
MRDNVIVITGGTAGVGRATALAFARRGAKVGIIARGTDGLEATAEELRSLGTKVAAIEADVADPEALESAAQQIEDELGPIDVWVNNAMAAVFAKVADTEPEELRRVTEVTYLGQAYGTIVALRRMRPRDRGTIVQVSSALAHRGIPLQATYCGAKHATKGFTESLITELLHDKSGVRVTMVALPGLNTPQFGWVRAKLGRHPRPVAPVYQPEVAAEAIVWAAENPRRELKVGFPTVATILGNHLAPWLLDRYLARTNIDGQLTDIVDEDREDYLFSPVDGDQGAHGIFDDEAKGVSPQLWLTQHRGLVTGALAAAALGVGVALRR